MKRSREPQDNSSSRVGPKKSKSIQACTSCRKHKTRCEILGWFHPNKSPVRCHRCQVLGLQCSYEETILPTASNSKLSSSPTSENTASASVTTNYPVHLPPTDRLWSFVTEDQNEIDWSAPMLAIQQLSKMPFAHLNPGPLPQPPPWFRRYTPWLNFKPTPNAISPLLDIVCCAIASRHLESVSGGAQVKLQLQKLTEDSIAKMIFNPRPSESVEAIQALLILSLWAPLGGPPENEGRDGRLLIASAVSMAMNLRLNQAAQKANAFRIQEKGRMSIEDTETLEEMLKHARLVCTLIVVLGPWLTSVLCLGTGRVPLSRRSSDDLQLIEFPKSFDNLLDYGDVRLGLAASCFDLVEEFARNRLQPGMDIDAWYDSIMVILEKMKRVKRLILPLSYVLDREHFYFHMLHIYQGMARLLVVYYALWDARFSVGNVPRGESWQPYFKPHGVEAVGEWGRDMVQTAEAVLVDILAADARLLGTAPDNVFTMCALAAGYVVGVKFLMFRGGSALAGSSDLILARTVTHLNNVACDPGHAAQRSAFLVKGMLAKWEARSSPQKPSSSVASYPTPTSDLLPDNSADGTPNSDYLESSAFPTQGPAALPPFEIDFSAFMDSTISLDADFWSNLAQTQLLAGYQG
ncbi:hypothetical protein C8R44DRAFT_775211 [Mycena epipterygia]|nr:hypothetical protein C8R44DRAFT_775211 [Mycena epipterygia]